MGLSDCDFGVYASQGRGKFTSDMRNGTRPNWQNRTYSSRKISGARRSLHNQGTRRIFSSLACTLVLKGSLTIHNAVPSSYAVQYSDKPHKGAVATKVVIIHLSQGRFDRFEIRSACHRARNICAAHEQTYIDYMTRRRNSCQNRGWDPTSRIVQELEKGEAREAEMRNCALSKGRCPSVGSM